MKTRYLYFDGASRGNPGPAAGGYVLYEHEEDEVEEQKKEVAAGFDVLEGRQTNNVAEYRGLIAGLECAVAHKWQHDLGGTIYIRGDSSLVINQMNGAWQVRTPHIRPLVEEAKRLVHQFGNVTVVFEHVRRNKNQRADAMANSGLDQKTED